MKQQQQWWRSAVIYQVYIRSFADADGDGLGDIAGLHAHLDHIAGLGVDAIWINPWYPSPFADAGYDVSDYRAIEPRFGTLDDAVSLVEAAHACGLRVLLDIVPNHTSDQHVWFQQALAAAPGSPERGRYIFRDGVGADGDDRPNDWHSAFGGPAWTRVIEADGTPGQWYLHLFAPEQPDLDWSHPEVRDDFLTTLRFWFDRGVDGFRIDVAHSLVKEEGLPDIGERSWGNLPFRLEPIAGVNQTDHPHWDRDEVHEIYRSWRELADSYDPPRIFVAEAWVPDPARVVMYVRDDELHTAFNFDFLRCPWVATELRAVVDATMREHSAVGATPTWVLSNHDVARHVSRLSREQTTGVQGHYLSDLSGPVDAVAGQRRARAFALLMFALPGGAYVYQGEEFGLPEVEDIADEALQDPVWERSEHRSRGRDGCRVPLPWSTDPGSAFGFGPDGGAAPWLPQPAWFADFAASTQHGVAGSMLELYRQALALRRAQPALGVGEGVGEGEMTWIAGLPEGAIGFTREPGFACLVNVSADAVPIPDEWAVMIASAPLTGRVLAADTTVWLSR